MEELLKDPVNVSETSNPQTPGVNQQREQRVRIVKGVELVVGMTNLVVIISLCKNTFN